jgi:nucleoside-diphosphate-sugar epimerase
MSTTVLITGATGMVGAACARRAIAAGYTVQAMVRANSDRGILDGVPVQFVVADLAEPESYPAALADAEIVVHTAAHVGDWGPAGKYRQLNVVALEHLVHAAAQSPKFRRWIQVSSLGVYPARHHYGTDETTPADAVGLDGYTRTKAEAEFLLNHHIQEHKFPAAIVRPGLIYGPGDRHILPRFIEKIESGQMKFLGRGDRVLNNTYVENLVDAIYLTFENSAALGETFNVHDERLVTREEFVNTIADYLGKSHPRHVPEWVARGLVKPIEALARMRGATEPPFLTAAQIKFMTLNLDYSIAKAKRVLGYAPRVDFHEGIRIALDDYALKRQRAASSQPLAAAV